MQIVRKSVDLSLGEPKLQKFGAKPYHQVKCIPIHPCWAHVHDYKQLAESVLQQTVPDVRESVAMQHLCHLFTSAEALTIHTQAWSHSMVVIDWKLSVSQEGATLPLRKCLQSSRDLERILTSSRLCHASPH